ncbi:MAG TPA: RDD family protein [Azospirillaceae bacterium]|nr:RDD family protein [Azospirillaceae bacterium]
MIRDEAYGRIGEDARLEGVRVKRMVAYVIDLIIIAVLSLPVVLVFALLGLLSLGLLTPVLAPLLAAVPLAYHTLLIGGGRSATVGMRMMGIEVRTHDGGRPDMVRAFLQTALFYLSVALTSALILLVSLVAERKRTLHDLLAGTVVVNR